MNLKSAFLCASAVLLIAAPARADVSPDVQKAITADYQSVCSAIMSGTDKDMDSIAALMSTDYKNVDFKGKETGKDDAVANMKQQMKMFRASSCDNSLGSFTQPDANTVVVVDTNNVKGTVQTPDGQHDVLATNKTQDTWKLAGGKWLQAQSKDLRALVKVDGNVVQDEGQ